MNNMMMMRDTQSVTSVVAKRSKSLHNKTNLSQGVVIVDTQLMLQQTMTSLQLTEVRERVLPR